jgi:hypothetical protein
MAFARPAEQEEIERCRDFLNTVRAKLRESGTAPDKLDAEAWQALVRVLFRVNEFVYLD